MKFMRLLAILFLVLPFCSQARIVDYVHDNNGHKIKGDGIYLTKYSRHFDNTHLAQLIEWYTIPGTLKNYTDSSDFAVALIQYGKVNTARVLLEKIALYRPDEYRNAMNLGTCYELIGMNDAALLWIKKAKQLNPKPHDGSEWVHIAILNAKIALKENPGWLKTHKVLGNKNCKPVLTMANKTTETRNVGFLFDEYEKQIIYALKERLPFTTPPDAILAAVLNELADYEAMSSLEFAILHYQLAQEYSGGNNPLIKAQINLLNKQLDSLSCFHYGKVFRNTSAFVFTPFDFEKGYIIRDKPVNSKPLSTILNPEPTDSINPDTATTLNTETGKQVRLPELEAENNNFWILIIGGIAIAGIFLTFWLKKNK